jgi:hypothetical protein
VLKESTRVTAPDIIANGVRVQRQETLALKKESKRVTSPENIANGVRVQKEETLGLKKSR